MRFNEVIFSDLATKTGLDKIHIKNLPSVVALAGKNGAGKTRFLNCITSMNKSIDITRQTFSYIQYDLSSRGLNSKGTRALKENYYNDFSIEACVEPGYINQVKEIISDVLSKFIKIINTDSIQELLMSIDGEADDTLMSRFNTDVKDFEDLLKYTVHNVDKSELQIIQRCGFNYIRKLSNSVIQEDLRFRLDIEKAKESPANKIFARINYFLDMFLHKKLEFNVEITPRGINFESNPQLLLAGRPFLHDELSPGEKILLTIALLFFVLDQNITFPLRECIILIDEPESHLHPDVQIRIVKGIKEIIDKKGQLFIATHSIALLSSLDRKERFLLKDGVYQKPISLHDSSFYQTTYDEVHELLGFDGHHAALQDYLSSPAYPDFCQLVRKLRVQELNKCAVRQFAGVHAHGVYFSGSLIMDICLLHLPQFVPNLP